MIRLSSAVPPAAVRLDRAAVLGEVETALPVDGKALPSRAHRTGQRNPGVGGGRLGRRPGDDLQRRPGGAAACAAGNQHPRQGDRDNNSDDAKTTGHDNTRSFSTEEARICSVTQLPRTHPPSSHVAGISRRRSERGVRCCIRTPCGHRPVSSVRRLPASVRAMTISVLTWKNKPSTNPAVLPPGLPRHPAADHPAVLRPRRGGMGPDRDADPVERRHRQAARRRPG